jgi:hypothetical protein
MYSLFGGELEFAGQSKQKGVMSFEYVPAAHGWQSSTESLP